MGRAGGKLECGRMNLIRRSGSVEGGKLRGARKVVSGGGTKMGRRASGRVSGEKESHALR